MVTTPYNCSVTALATIKDSFQVYDSGWTY
jgi:hypothetical protein